MVRASLSQTVRGRALFVGFAFLIGLLAAQSAQAQATFTVTRTDDRNTVCASGVDCSLREAVNAANTAATNDTITFNIPATSCTAGVCTITLTSGELVITASGTLTIANSTGAGNLLISGNNTSRVFFVNSGANLTLNNVTVTGGNATTNCLTSISSTVGSGICNNGGTLAVTNSTVSGNTGNNFGGGISNGGTLTVTNSIISNNAPTAGNGGGIFNGGTGATMTIINSTISNNTRGGISNNSTGNGMTVTNSTISGNTVARGIVSGGAATITNSTISGNTAGGLSIGGLPVTVTNSTIANNSVTTGSGGGILRQGSTLNLGNTIVAGNTAPTAPDISGIVVSQDYNLIQNTSGATINGTTTNNIYNQSPLLDPLANYGGSTQTHRLQTGSPAIDKGNSFGSTTDQRGFTRPFDNPSIAPATGGDNADIGAFEVQPAAPTAATVTISGRAQTSTGRGIRNVLIRLTDGEGHTRFAMTTAFGYYRFTNVSAGETVIITAKGKRYEFAQPTQVLNVNEDASDVNFVAY